MKKQRKIKTLISTIILILLIFCSVSQVFASISITESNNTATIKVGGIENGVTVSSYKIVNVNFNYTAGQPESPAYSWVNEIKDWLTANYNEYLDLENFYETVSNNSSEAQNFYDDLTKAIKDGTITLNPTDSVESTGTEVTFLNKASMGTYLIIAENGYKVYTPTISNIVPQYNSTNKKWEINEEYTVIAKSTDPQITKTVTNSEKTKDNYSTTDTISYEIIGDVPTFLNNSLSKTYKIIDTLPKGMTYNKDSIKVYDVTTGTELNGNHVIIDTTDNQTFICDFNYENIKDFEKVKVVYTTTLNKDSSLSMGESGNSNNAKLQYSNNPYIADSLKEKTLDTENKVYTYGIQITNVDKKEQDKVLTDSEFTLSIGEETLYFIKTEDGTYYKAQSTDVDATTNLVVDSNGVVRLYGLDEDIYTLTQTKAPEEYSIATSTVTVNIEDEDLNGILDDSGDTDGIAKVKFTNTKFFLLPLTGGTGTVAFVVVGSTLIGIGAVVMILKKQKEAKSKVK